MPWKKSLQLLDLDSGERLELTCVTCGHVRIVRDPHTLTRSDTGESLSHLYLDELERGARCGRRANRALAGKDCGGRVSLLLVDPATKPVPFIAGITMNRIHDPAADWRKGTLKRQREAERKAMLAKGERFKRTVGRVG